MVLVRNAPASGPSAEPLDAGHSRRQRRAAGSAWASAPSTTLITAPSAAGDGNGSLAYAPTATLLAHRAPSCAPTAAALAAPLAAAALAAPPSASHPSAAHALSAVGRVSAPSGATAVAAANPGVPSASASVPSPTARPAAPSDPMSRGVDAIIKRAERAFASYDFRTGGPASLSTDLATFDPKLEEARVLEIVDGFTASLRKRNKLLHEAEDGAFAIQQHSSAEVVAHERDRDTDIETDDEEDAGREASLLARSAGEIGDEIHARMLEQVRQLRRVHDDATAVLLREVRSARGSSSTTTITATTIARISTVHPNRRHPRSPPRLRPRHPPRPPLLCPPPSVPPPFRASPLPRPPTASLTPAPPPSPQQVRALAERTARDEASAQTSGASASRQLARLESDNAALAEDLAMVEDEARRMRQRQQKFETVSKMQGLLRKGMGAASVDELQRLLFEQRQRAERLEDAVLALQEKGEERQSGLAIALENEISTREKYALALATRRRPTRRRSTKPPGGIGPHRPPSPPSAPRPLAPSAPHPPLPIAPSAARPSAPLAISL